MSSSSLKDYKNKLNLLEKYNKFYYQDQKPIVSDKEFDKLKREIIE